MAAKVKPRDVTPIIQAVRNWLGQRKLVRTLRFEDYVSPRSAPPPKLPPGINHKLSANLYYARDGRRQAEPPVVVYDTTKLIASKMEKAETSVSSASSIPKPGSGYDWNTGSSN
ncbi:hypothetical protein HELRODRAFT_161235 [Helobdella robusta]|uniref:NADH dehydrogenase [ubiquinone] 1 alpha subcomplex subunit 7 n=1 Tax=Helobdella robusta TaxID=6412 RepID=T1ER87_HELRO|nr:hypothetical protein HELRODRAFT_161235 [Helobdella robusta]ESO02015.1 hypothetical protein HELRODRAFT_161235 [Helobdella robusta]